MPDVVNVRFRSKGKAYFFDPAGTEPRPGDSVIVETAKGTEIGECVRGAHFVEETAIVPPLRPVIRIATEGDKAIARENRAKEKTAFEFCQKKIAERGLDMKLVDVEYSFDNSKILFFFTSDGRVDFRELVKDLAGVFRTRIELRQIGVRDSAKLVGGLGICGRPFCCSTFLEDFQPVSIKMAKTQSLSLNPTKISGTCGRLMCCLKYEQDAYEHLLKTVPKAESEVDTPNGKGTVKEVNLLRRTVKVKLADEGVSELRTYPASVLGFTVGGVYKEPEPPEEPLEEERSDAFSSRYSFKGLDPMPSLFNDKGQEHFDGAEQHDGETKGEGGKNRHRNRNRHRNKKSQGERQAAEKIGQNEKQEKQPQQKAKPQQPAQEKQANHSGGHSKSRRPRGGSGKSQQGSQNRQPAGEASKPAMDEKAKARAAAVAQAVAQAKPNSGKRNHHPRRKSNATSNAEK